MSSNISRAIRSKFAPSTSAATSREHFLTPLQTLSSPLTPFPSTLRREAAHFVSREAQIRDPHLLATVRGKTGNLEDDYLVSSRSLASGKFGVVRVAEDNNTNKASAVKTISRKCLKSDLKEVEIVNSIESEYVMSFDSVYLTRRKCHLVSPLYLGGDLFDLIVSRNTSSFDEQNAAALFRQVLGAISDCHDHDIVHLDIKPENFCIENSVAADGDQVGELARLILIDFGYAIRLDERKALVSGDNSSEKHLEWRLRNVAGSVTYAAPELTHSRYSKASDLWSAGVVLYILLAGQPPWQQDLACTVEQKAKLIEGLNGRGGMGMKRHATVWKNASPAARDLVSKLLVIDPSQRLTAKEALAHPFLNDGGADEAVLEGICSLEEENELPLAA
eukprot:g5019.t1